MEEETREQPVVSQANVSSETNDFGAESDAGSQNNEARQTLAPEQSEFGKFKSAQALLQAYNNLEAEFTKKCQKLSQLEKDKTDAPQSQIDIDGELGKFLSQNGEAAAFSEEIKELISSNKGERVSSTKPDTPTSLKEAKSLVEKMFS